MVPISGQWIWRSLAVAAGLTIALAAPAHAQASINFSGGASIDPEQGYVGVAWESPDLGGRFRVRPGIDGGFGSGLRTGAINFDLIVRIPLGQSPWALIQGGGPTITITKYSDSALQGMDDELHAGGTYLFGFTHDSGFSVEFRVGGGGYVPGLKIGAGFAVKMQ